MKVKIGDQIIDSNDQPIMLIFENDKQLKTVASNLYNMKINPGKVRKYVEYDDKKKDIVLF